MLENPTKVYAPPQSGLIESVVSPTSLNFTPSPNLRMAYEPRHDDASVNSTWAHRAWLASGCIVVSIAIAKSILPSIGSGHWVQPILAALFGYIFADFGSGVYHWAIDNYGDAKTPIFGEQIEGFQGHHKKPWVIARHDMAVNLHALSQAVTVIGLPINLFFNNPTLMAFVATLSGFVLFSQQFHAWSHSRKSDLPKVVVVLQDLGLLLSRSQHAAHHHLPYNNNYCIVSGVCNTFLDENKIFEVLESLLFKLFQVRPRSWGEPKLEWIEKNSNGR